MTSPLSALGPDTKNHLLSFLPLMDCLVYGQVSRQALLDILPSLKMRRDQQFGERHAYHMKNPTRLVPVKDIPSLTDPLLLVQPLSEHEEEQWHVLPSAAERLEGLYRALPQGHSGKDLARELMLEVQGRNREAEEEDAPAPLWGDHYHASMEQLRSLLKAHKLHDLLLSKSTLHCRPVTADPRLTVQRNQALTVTLDQYMGDVLIAAYSMAHSIAGLVEGPNDNTYQKWTESLKAQGGMDTPDQGYREFIFLHSALLRMLPMKPEWLHQMKLLPLCGIQGQVNGSAGTLDFIGAPLPFLANADTLETLKHLIGRTHNNWSHMTRFDDFGPLGPAFRGRDRVRTLTMNPGSIARYVGMFGSLQNYLQQHQITIHAWLQHAEAETSWMLNLSTECYRSRPMTVQPPRVTISPAVE